MQLQIPIRALAVLALLTGSAAYGADDRGAAESPADGEKRIEDRVDPHLKAPQTPDRGEPDRTTRPRDPSPSDLRPATPSPRETSTGSDRQPSKDRREEPAAPTVLPAIQSASPSSVSLEPGGRVRVRLLGTGLDTLGAPEARAGGRPVSGIDLEYAARSGRQATLVLALPKPASVRGPLTVHLMGSRSPVEVPLRLELVAVAKRESPSLPADERADSGRPGPMTPAPQPFQQQVQLVVRVVDDDTGNPISGASVCLGTDDSPLRHGIRTTDGDGRARFSRIPEEEDLVAIVSRQGYEGREEEVDYDPENAELEGCGPFVGSEPPDPDAECEPYDVDTVELDPGAGGPTCPPDGALASLRIAVTNGENAVVCVGIPGDASRHGAFELSAGEDVELELQPQPIRILVDHAGYEPIMDPLYLTGEVERSYTLVPGEGGGRIRKVADRCEQFGPELTVPGPLEALPVPDPEPEPEPEPEAPAEPDPDPAPARGEPHTVDGRSAVDFAQQHGFTFLASPGCTFGGPPTGDAFWVAWGITSPCTFALFEGRNLNPGWRLTQVFMLPDDTSFEYAFGEGWSDEPGGDASFTIEATACPDPDNAVPGPLGAACFGNFMVRLIGPVGGDWQDAFRQD